MANQIQLSPATSYIKAMKTFLLLISLVLFTNHVAFSQVEIVEGETYGNERLEEFAGTWVGTTQSDSLVVKMWVGKVYIESIKVYKLNTFGQYDYWRNGKPVERTIGSADTTLFGASIEENPFRLRGLFYNGDMELVGEFNISTDQPDSSVAGWAIEPRNHIIRTSSPTTEVPKIITLRRIE